MQLKPACAMISISRAVQKMSSHACWNSFTSSIDLRVVVSVFPKLLGLLLLSSMNCGSWCNHPARFMPRSTRGCPLSPWTMRFPSAWTNPVEERAFYIFFSRQERENVVYQLFTVKTNKRWKMKVSLCLRFSCCCKLQRQSWKRTATVTFWIMAK